MVAQRTSCVLAIDGRSGAGKTTLAAAIARETGAQLLAVETLYRGWDGLAYGADYLAREVLTPLQAGRTVTPQRWNWHTSGFAQGTPVHPGLLIVEGCGALSRASRPLINFGVWCEADAQLRYWRATMRDGSNTWWDAWRAQEDAFYAREGSAALADLTLSADIGVAEALAVLTRHGWPGC